MDTIHKLLEELYSTDPSLKEFDAQLRTTLQEIIDAKPNASLDVSFENQLRKQLQARARELSKEPRFSGMTGFLHRLTLQSTIAITVVLLLALFVGMNLGGNSNVSDDGVAFSSNSDRVEKFKSDAEFIAYLDEARTKSAGGYGYGGGVAVDTAVAAPVYAQAESSADAVGRGGGGQEVDRYSDTNVQVLGIDEPDMVKTNGSEIYYSPQQYFYYYREAEPLMATDSSFRAPEISGKTYIFGVDSPEDIDLIDSIPHQGTLLLDDETLVVFSNNRVYGYDVSDPSDPQEEWDMELKNAVVSARLYDGKLYMVTQDWVNYEKPCPIIPLVDGMGREISIPCTDVYRPEVTLTDFVTFNAFSIDPSNGEVEDKLSFLGAANSSIVYMSENALYVTYTHAPAYGEIMMQFILEDGRDLFPSDFVSRVKEIQSYDIGSSAKMTELNELLERFYRGMDDVERRNFDRRYQNRLEVFVQDNIEELQTTGIVKIALDLFKVTDTGSIPGVPLNQFSLDEDKGNLRIASTLGQGWFGGAQVESQNAVYVLDGDLDVIGSVRDLGITERIYSARFIGERGYLVTFRQIDPFYVLDLSNPRRPEVKGELKIPGYSSYLHPLTDDVILGVGQEDWRTKLSLFDVSDPSNPVEIDKYTLDAGWSEVANNHHAFLHDAEHEAFFLPAGGAGYVFSYDLGARNEKMELEAFVDDVQAERAIYINDTMYIIGPNGIVSLDEDTWDEVERFDF